MSVTALPRKSKAAKPADHITSLVLAIDHQVYSLELLTPGYVMLKAYQLSKRGADGAVYNVARDMNGNTCDCPDFVFRREGLDPLGCKHLRAMVKFGLLPAPDAKPAPVVAPVETLPTRNGQELADDLAEFLAGMADIELAVAPAELAPVEAPIAPTASAPCRCEVEAPELAPIDPGDIESDPATWGPEWDAWTWELGPELEYPVRAYRPSEADRREAATLFAPRPRLARRGRNAVCGEISDTDHIDATGCV